LKYLFQVTFDFEESLKRTEEITARIAVFGGGTRKVGD
jgi:hypothetical protein